ncbi:MAG: hypothetical protein IPL32_06660 [Chloracidobacterium sp.]|nr:hypothetical protein [Chloracidobacterium sp.]
MKLPLLGIIAVVCLQLGFTALNAIDRPIESLVAVNAVTKGTNPLAATLDPTDAMFAVSKPIRSGRRWNSGDTITSAASWRRETQNTQSSYVQVKKNSSAKTLRRMSQLVAEHKPFESTVITYPRVMLATNDSDNFRITTASVKPSAPEKRSFASKTGSILKKPYTWIKALGSKLN